MLNFKKHKPFSPSQRHVIQLNLSNLIRKPLIKKNLKGKKNKAGRNNSGQITIKHKGGGHKRKYRIIKFARNNESSGIVCSIEYDPNRNANIASIYEFGSNNFFYILAPKNLKIGDIVESGSNVRAKLGNSLPLEKIPIGSLIHNIEPITGKTGQITRSAGTFSILKEKSLKSARIELSSGEQRHISPNCYATIGSVSNELFFLIKHGKAGRARWLNKRPVTRGVAMNPVDHPHGGGEGKKSGKGKTFWGKPVKKGKTSKTRNKLIIQK
jgi:large subunit ribosomal protein L2